MKYVFFPLGVLISSLNAMRFDYLIWFLTGAIEMQSSDTKTAIQLHLFFLLIIKCIEQNISIGFFYDLYISRYIVPWGPSLDWAQCTSASVFYWSHKAIFLKWAPAAGYRLQFNEESSSLLPIPALILVPSGWFGYYHQHFKGHFYNVLHSWYLTMTCSYLKDIRLVSVWTSLSVLITGSR